MNLRKSLVSTAASFAIVAGMLGGVVSADPAEVTVNYGCETTPGSVSVAVDGVIDYDTGASSGGGATVEVELDLTCNYSANFQVSASIGTFYLQGPGSGNPLMATAFSGAHFLMEDGDVTGVNFPLIDGFTSEPDVQETVFAGFVTEEDAVVQDNDVFAPIPWIPILGLFQSSPGISTIEWDASVNYLPINLTPGTYIGDLTVDLTVN